MRNAGSGPAKLGLVQPKRVEQCGEFARNGDPGALRALGFGDLSAPLLERAWSLELGQQEVGGFVERSAQHRIASL